MSATIDKIGLLLPNGTVTCIRENGIELIPFKVPLGTGPAKVEVTSRILVYIDYIVLMPVQVNQIEISKINEVTNINLMIAVNNKDSKLFHLNSLEGYFEDFDHLPFSMKYASQGFVPGSVQEWEAIINYHQSILIQYRNMIYVTFPSTWKQNLEYPGLQLDAMLDSLTDGLNLCRFTDLGDPSKCYFIVNVDITLRKLNITRYDDRITLPKFNEL